MGKVQFDCRVCKKKTTQIIMKVTDNLPPGVEVVQCVACETMGVVLVGEPNANV